MGFAVGGVEGRSVRGLDDTALEESLRGLLEKSDVLLEAGFGSFGRDNLDNRTADGRLDAIGPASREGREEQAAKAKTRAAATVRKGG